MAVEFGLVDSEDDLLAVQALRYDVYVEEIGWFRSEADHENRRLADPEDRTSWIFYARDGDRMVGSTRITWGGDGFSDRQIEQYQLGPFLDDVPAEQLAVGERTMIRPEYRGTSVLMEMMLPIEAVQADHDVRVVFGCCEPHLFNLYTGMGQRPYATKHINSESGYFIPLVASIPTGAPPVDHSSVRRALEGGGRVSSATVVGDGPFDEQVRRELGAWPSATRDPFAGMEADEVAACIARSTIIDCDEGDVLLRRGGEARNMFVALVGSLEVRDGDRVVATLGPGDVFGEMAYLLERPRSLDVVVSSADTRVLSLSAGAVRTMIASEPTAAAKLLLHLAEVLARRLTHANHS